MVFERALPEFKDFLTFWKGTGGFNLTVPPHELARPFIAAFPPPVYPDAAEISVESIKIEGHFRCLIVRPAVSVGLDPVIIAYHGGGAVVGTPELELPLYTYFARHGFAVISPDYRLAPEHPYPAQFDDAETTWNYIHSNSAALRLNCDNVGLFGSSAGSWIAAGLAIRLRDKGGHVPSIVVLDSTLVDDRVCHPAQKEGHVLEDYYIWTRQNAIDARRYIFGDSDTVPLEAAPLRSSNPLDFVGLCPHYISICELDSLVNHGVEYSKLLLEAGVSVETHIWRGTIHGFVTLLPEAEVTGRARAEYLAAFKFGITN